MSDPTGGMRNFGLLVRREAPPLPVFGSTRLHARAVALRAMATEATHN